MGRLINADTLKDKMIKYGFHAIDMTVTEFVEDMLPPVEAIPKADYENRLKADMVAMLEELYMEVEELDTPSDDYYDACIVDCERLIQQKIDKLKGEENGN